MGEYAYNSLDSFIQKTTKRNPIEKLTIEHQRRRSVTKKINNQEKKIPPPPKKKKKKTITSKR